MTTTTLVDDGRVVRSHDGGRLVRRTMLHPDGTTVIVSQDVTLVDDGGRTYRKIATTARTVTRSGVTLVATCYPHTGHDATARRWLDYALREHRFPR